MTTHEANHVAAHGWLAYLATVGTRHLARNPTRRPVPQPEVCAPISTRKPWRWPEGICTAHPTPLALQENAILEKIKQFDEQKSIFALVAPLLAESAFRSSKYT